jgi:membrane protein DedA with SNARE-associated domain
MLTALGSLLWTALLAVAGYYLEHMFERVSDYLNPISNVVFGGLFIWYVWRVATFRPQKA